MVDLTDKAPTITLEDNHTSVIPTDKQLEARVEKFHYALGPDSPGQDVLRQTIANGNEGPLRSSMAANHDAKTSQVKQELVTRLAQTNGGNITQQQARAIMSPSTATDPNDALEKIYAGRFVTDLDQANRLNASPATRTVMSEIMARGEWLNTQHERLQREWENTGWLTTIKDIGVSLIPFVSWWRQAQALDRPMHGAMLPGSTIRDNVAYVLTQPTFEAMKAKYNQAMEYFRKSGNILDAMTFDEALRGYSKSQEFIDSMTGIADLATVASPAVKIASGLFRTTKVASEAKVLDNTIKQAAQERPSLPKETFPAMGNEQLDLFGPQPAQGSFRFMNRPEQRAPILESKIPPGKLRATHVTDFDTYGSDFAYQLPANARSVPDSGLFRDDLGRIRRSSAAYKQGELNLSTIEHQGSLDFVGGSGQSLVEKYEAAPKRSLTPEVEFSGVTPASEPPPIRTAAEQAQANKYAEAMVQKQQQAVRSLSEGIQATAGSVKPDPEAVLGASGNIREAGFLGALSRIMNPLGEGNIEWSKHVPTFMAPDGFYKDSKVIARTYAQNLVPHLLKTSASLIENYTRLARVPRLTAEQAVVARDLAEQSLRKEFGKHNTDAIINVTYTDAEKHPATIDTVHLHIGMPDGKLFPTEEKAVLFRDEHYKLKKQAQVMPQGSGYYLRLSKHVDETHPAVQAVFTPDDATNLNPVNQLLGKLRSAEDLLSKFQRGNRHLAVHAPQEIRRVTRDFIEQNIRLSKQENRELADILRENRDMPSRNNPAERGLWYETAGEFEEAFVARFKKLPTKEQVIAYDNYKRLSDFEWMIRNTAVYRDIARQGYEQFRYNFSGKKTPWFNGKELDEMPWGIGDAKYDAGIWVWDSKTGKGTFYYQFKLSPEEKKAINHLIENEGYRVVQIFEPRKHPLQGIAKRADGTDLEDQVNYVITNTWEKKPLAWQQVDYRPGGHSIYKHNWYIAVPDIRVGRDGRMTYFGDKNILNLSTRAQAAKFVDRMNYARTLYRDQKLDELNEYIDKFLPHSQDEFYDLFRRNDSPADPNQPFVLKQAGFNSLETEPGLRSYAGGDLIDGTKNPHDPSNFMDKSYLMDRDNVLKTVLEHDGELRLGNAEQLDPYLAMSKAMNQAFRNIWMTDYKISAVEKWMREFGPAGHGALKPSQSTLEAHPLYFLYNPQYMRAASTNQDIITAAKASQQAIVNFLGHQTELGKSLEAFKMRLLDSVYNKFGQGKLLDTVLVTTSDPVHFLRGLAFHSKLGLFNPVQFWIQAQSMFHSIAVAGIRNGGRGFMAAPLIRWLGHNPNMLDTVAEVATKVGWTQNEFKEMYDLLRNTGLYQVAGEAALRDDTFDPSLFRSTFGYMLDAGAMFFNEGERLTRLSAFATAYREYRAANKLGKIGDRELGQILRRADDLSVNMTRASNAAWQTGVWSIPTQFYTYNLRIMEQLLGNRLTGAEKFRMLAVYSALYGIPIGVGIGVGGVWPVYDSVKEEAFRRGYNLNEGWLKIASEGLLSYAVSLLTGKDYNVAQRYGPGNQQALKEAWEGDKSIPELVFGASGSIAGALMSSVIDPLYYKTASIVNGTEYPLKASDWWNFFRQFSTVDIAFKASAAWAYGEWLTKTGTVVTDADGMDAAMAFLGLTPRAATDTFLWMSALRGQKDTVKEAGRLAMEQYRFGLQAQQQGDTAGFHDYMARVQTILQAARLNYVQKNALYHNLIQQGRPLSETIKWDALRNAPQGEFQNFFENFIRNPNG